MSTLVEALVKALRMEREIAFHLQSEFLNSRILEEELRDAERRTDELVRQVVATLDVTREIDE